jgi:uncharacterized protein
MQHPQRTEVRYLQRLGWRGALLSLCLIVSIAAHAQVGPLEDLAAFPSGELVISGGKERRVFTVWLADNPARQAQGLMFVRSLPPLRGMLFVHAEPRPLSMWMKNTYIALDMVFIGADGHIQQIIANTKPHSEDLIRSKKPALAVLELAAGEAERLGLRAGQRVQHAALGKKSDKH